jgi:hypothetical protein
MDPRKSDPQRPRVSRATSLRLERQKHSEPSGSIQGNPGPGAESSEAIPKARDPSPTKLPVGSFRRTNSVRQASGVSAQTETSSHRRHGSASSIGQPRNDGSTRRPAQASTLRSVKESLLSKDSEDKPRPPIAQKVTPTARQPAAHARTVSQGNVNLQSARKDKQQVPLTEPKASPPRTRHASSHPRNASLGSMQAPSREQRSIAASSSSTQRSVTLRSDNLVESSLELLQLHAIHSRSGKTQREWMESARKFYESQFKEVVAFKDAMKAREVDLLVQRNAAAVIEWGSRTGGDTLERRVQVLSSTLDEAWQLSNPTGQYTSIVQAFEHWHENAAKLQERPSTGSKASQQPLNVVEGLGDGWKAEVATLQEGLLQAANDILSLGDIEGESDIVRSITLVLELINNMLEELELMESIEQHIVQQQRGWVQSSLNELRRDI